MKRSIIWSLSLFALALALAGCAKKAAWLPLLSTPDPNRTPILHTYPAEGAGPVEPGEDKKIFTTDVEEMESPRIVVYKSRHVLEVWDGETLMARMKVALGREDGAKQKSGDNKTPEGEYYVCKTSDEGRYYKSLFLSYPNSSDATLGLDEGWIKQDQYDKIVNAIDRRQVPLWNTSLGGEIAISGTGTAGEGKTGDWTAGSVVVSDEDMDYLWKFIKTGVDVEINP